jgi:hypothetical protein
MIFATNAIISLNNMNLVVFLMENQSASSWLLHAWLALQT